MMQEYFEKLLDWCKVRIAFITKESAVVFKEGEIWWCSIGLNIGEEVFGKGIKFTRPVLIFKKFTKNSFLGLPLTGQEKTGSWYITINMPGRTSSAMLNQVRVFDRIRLRDRIATMKDSDFQAIKEKFRDFYFPRDSSHPASAGGGDQWEIPNSL